MLAILFEQQCSEVEVEEGKVHNFLVQVEILDFDDIFELGEDILNNYTFTLIIVWWIALIIALIIPLVISLDVGLICLISLLIYLIIRLVGLIIGGIVHNIILRDILICRIILVFLIIYWLRVVRLWVVSIALL